jgi:hypothetical protein
MIHVKEGNPSAEFGVIRVVRKDGPTLRVDLRGNVHNCLVAHIPQHPLRKSTHREPTRTAAPVLHLEHGELDRCVHGHVHPYLRGDTALRMFEYGISESVPGNVRIVALDRMRHRGPEMAALLVSKVKCLSA